MINRTAILRICALALLAILGATVSRTETILQPLGSPLLRQEAHDYIPWPPASGDEDGDAVGCSTGCGNGGHVSGGGTESPGGQTSVGDEKILAHSGQESRTVTDLFVPGIDSAVDLKFRRRHLTRINNAGSVFGEAWAFNYQHYVREVQFGGDLDFTGFGRTDSFRYNPLEAQWEGALGRIDTATLDDVADQITVHRRKGLAMVFYAPININTGLREGYLVEIRSPNLNKITITYDESEIDLSSRWIDHITDCFGRNYSFIYNDLNFPTQVTHIVDEAAGTTILYAYQPGPGDLITVVRENSNPYSAPDPTTTYGYLGGTDPLMEHALVLEVAPNEFVPGNIGISRLAWTYYSDTSKPYYGFVKSHTVGNTGSGTALDAGGTYNYSYVIGLPRNNLQEVTVQTTVVDRRGTTIENSYNFLGQLLVDKVEAQVPPLRPGSAVASWTFTNEVNEDGLWVSTVPPTGGGMAKGYVPVLVPRINQGNVDLEVETADGRGADQATITTKYVYEPVYNHLYQVIEPRGFEGTNNPADYTTTYIYDYMEDLATSIPAIAASRGQTAAQINTQLAAAGITSILDPDVDIGDINGDLIVDQFCGNLIKVRHPAVTIHPDADPSVTPPGSIQNAVELMQYNSYGQITKRIDAEENVTEFEYWDILDPSGFAGSTGGAGGYISKVTRDTTLSAGRNGGANPDLVNASIEFEYTTQFVGAQTYPSNTRGIPTAIIDSRGTKTAFFIDNLDRVVETCVAASADVAAGLVAYQYKTRFYRDANGNITERWIQHADTLVPGEDTWMVTSADYNILDLLSSVEQDVGGVGSIVKYEYDANLNKTRVTRGFGSPEVAVEETVYDERNLVVSRKGGAGSPEESTWTTLVDINGNLTAVIDAVGGQSITYEYDGYDRLIKEIDRVGTQSETGYDAVSNVINSKVTGKLGAPASLGIPTANILLTETDYIFDKRNRLSEVGEHLFHYPGLEIGAIDDGSSTPTAGIVSTVLVRDRLNRIVEHIDAESDSTLYQWDGDGRQTGSTDPMGNGVSTVFDDNGNALQVAITETSPLIATDEVFTSSYTYDSLNRRATATEPNTALTSYQYDSRDNFIRKTDALGNQREATFDRLNRLLETRQYLSTDGLMASATNLDVNQGGSDGIITLAKSWDALHRLRTRTDDNGNVTTTTWDTLDRQTRLDYGDGTFETWQYNDDNELTQHVNQMGSISTYDNDSRGRPTEVNVVNLAGSGLGGSIRKEWAYDGLDRAWQDLDYNSSASHDNVRTFRYYDSLSRVIQENSHMIGTNAVRNVTNEYQGHSRMVRQTYPNGRVVERAYDALDRISEIAEDLSSGTFIARDEYVGRGRLLQRTYGNGAVMDKRNDAGTQSVGGANPGFDSNGRTIRQEWKLGMAQVAAYVSTWNGPSGVGTNRRNSEEREHMFSHKDTYTFDSAYRMLSFDRDGGNLSTRAFDGADKLVSFIDEGVDRMPRVDMEIGEEGLNQYSSFDGGAQVYNDNGSLTAPDSNTQYIFDSSNRLVELSRNGSLAAMYAYDVSGRRYMSFNLIEGFTLHYYDDWRVLEDYAPAAQPAAVRRQYVDGARVDEHLQIKNFEQVGDLEFYFHCNDQGSVGAISDQSGLVVEFYEYSMMGVPTVVAFDKVTPLAASPSGNRYAFQGRRFDFESGLYYFRNRYYSPKTGGFIMIDPSGLWTHTQGNGYSSFAGDAWNVHDPLGLEVYKVSRGVGVSVLGPIAGFVAGSTHDVLVTTGPGKKPTSAGGKNPTSEGESTLNGQLDMSDGTIKMDPLDEPGNNGFDENGDPVAGAVTENIPAPEGMSEEEWTDVVAKNGKKVKEKLDDSDVPYVPRGLRGIVSALGSTSVHPGNRRFMKKYIRRSADCRDVVDIILIMSYDEASRRLRRRAARDGDDAALRATGQFGDSDDDD